MLKDLKPTRWIVIAAGIALCFTIVLRQAEALDRSDEGYALAQRWCQSCHVIEAGQNASSRAPAFTEIASNNEITDGYLRTWLSIPHTQMPDFNLSRNEISALIDYFNSLRAE
ncbi:c-type cytochrome [Denitrobaculum tricleocarpae]|uniref:Cytochrome c n=1 Tax=Denitrobaculum tricleocarpae TaxID=2591009 RepID=A0A545TY05_9PROT|nr:cytochrome c [Denitrobaculum tricleocarpae]TQV82087.1 cytochrome c [Denitrobaculum tricleocarpae]